MYLPLFKVLKKNFDTLHTILKNYGLDYFSDYKFHKTLQKIMEYENKYSSNIALNAASMFFFDPEDTCCTDYWNEQNLDNLVQIVSKFLYIRLDFCTLLTEEDSDIIYDSKNEFLRSKKKQKTCFPYLTEIGNNVKIYVKHEQQRELYEYDKFVQKNFDIYWKSELEKKNI